MRSILSDIEVNRASKQTLNHRYLEPSDVLRLCDHLRLIHGEAAAADLATVVFVVLVIAAFAGPDGWLALSADAEETKARIGE